MAQMKKPAPKPTTKAKPLTGPAAVKEYQRQVSPAGVKKAEVNAKKGIDKKYPGLYKKGKAVVDKVNKAKESTTLSPKEKAGLKKGLEKIKADSKKKAKAEVKKRKAPDSNFIARM
jgi:hypothetical protein